MDNQVNTKLFKVFFNNKFVLQIKTVQFVLLKEDC